MSSALEFTGERFVPGIPGEIVYEHWHRYAFASRFVSGKNVLDVACGEGYGSALLGRSATQVTGIDISEEAVAHAKSTYRAQQNIRFLQGSAAKLPLLDASVDVVVSFETIEHLPQSLQQPMIKEFARVLTPNGLLIISSPNRPEYSPPGTEPNPFHVHELDKEELLALLMPDFPAQMWWAQRLYFASTLWREEESDGQTIIDAETKEALSDGVIATTKTPKAKYFIVLASRNEQALPDDSPWLSLFSDEEEKELQRLYHEAREALRLDKLAKQKIEDLDQLLLAHQEQCALTTRLHEEIDRYKVAEEHLTQELNYRKSWRGWLRFPLSQLKRRFRKST